MILGGTQAESYSQMYCDWLSPQNPYLREVTHLIYVKLRPLQSVRKELSLRIQQHVRYFIRLKVILFNLVITAIYTKNI